MAVLGLRTGSNRVIRVLQTTIRAQRFDRVIFVVKFGNECFESLFFRVQRSAFRARDFFCLETRVRRDYGGQETVESSAVISVFLLLYLFCRYTHDISLQSTINIVSSTRTTARPSEKHGHCIIPIHPVYNYNTFSTLRLIDREINDRFHNIILLLLLVLLLYTGFATNHGAA